MYYTCSSTHVLHCRIYTCITCVKRVYYMYLHMYYRFMNYMCNNLKHHTCITCGTFGRVYYIYLVFFLYYGFNFWPLNIPNWCFLWLCKNIPHSPKGIPYCQNEYDMAMWYVLTSYMAHVKCYIMWYATNHGIILNTEWLLRICHSFSNAISCYQLNDVRMILTFASFVCLFIYFFRFFIVKKVYYPQWFGIEGKQSGGLQLARQLSRHTLSIFTIDITLGNKNIKNYTIKCDVYIIVDHAQ